MLAGEMDMGGKSAPYSTDSKNEKEKEIIII